MYSSRRPFTSERIVRPGGSSFFSVKKILFFFVFCFILLYGVIATTGNTLVKEGRYTISRGDTVYSLREKFDFPIASWRYSLWVRYFAPEILSLQIGEYETSSPTALQDFFLSTLKKPIHIDETITILPGWNIYDIDAYLSNKKIISTGDFLKNISLNFPLYKEEFDFIGDATSLEGFLYPDTYRIRRDATAHDITRILLGQFEKALGEKYKSLGANGYKELILASIVEREERNKKEQSMVAGILAKRVKEGIPMGADATVCTGYAKTQKQCTPRFIGEVISIKHPFNTRNKQGYPPTPISNISLAVWDNTLGRLDSPYYYYLHDSDGVIHYATTLEGHIENKNTYLK